MNPDRLKAGETAAAFQRATAMHELLLARIVSLRAEIELPESVAAMQAGAKAASLAFERALMGAHALPLWDPVSATEFCARAASEGPDMVDAFTETTLTPLLALANQLLYDLRSARAVAHPKGGA